MQLLGEPAPTQADLHFRLFGIPVRVHPFFWLTTLLLGMGGRDEVDPMGLLIWIVVVFVSILVHEFGHAFTQRFFRGHPWVTLYSFGGLASCNDCDRSPRAQLLISFAGPFAGFLFAALVVLGMAAAGRFHGFVLNWFPVRLELFGSWLDMLILDLLAVNIFWGLLNLLPVYPLDGGQISRELFTLGNPRQGIVRSLWLSVAAAAAVAAYALSINDLYLCIMFGLLAFGSYQALQRYGGGRR